MNDEMFKHESNDNYDLRNRLYTLAWIMVAIISSAIIFAAVFVY